MKSYWLQGFIVALISSCTTSVLVRIPSLSSNQCSFEKEKASMDKFVYNQIYEQFLREYGTWNRVAYLNMSDLTQFCPSGWSTNNSTVRACGRPELKHFSCNSTFFSTHGMEYSQVSGRITGYQYGAPHAFHFSIYYNPGIDNPYIDGVSLTHGAPGSRTHVWSFVNAWTEQSVASTICACMFSNYSEWPYTVPDFVGNNYFCATGRSHHPYNWYAILSQNPLWDGKGCTGNNTCCQFNHPPWFHRILPAATTDDIEVRICAGNSNTDIFIDHIELYVK